MDCLDLNITYEIQAENLLFFSEDSSSPDMRDVEILGHENIFPVLETGTGFTQIAVRGTCPGTGIPLKKVYTITWDWEDVEDTMSITASEKCCPSLIACYDYMVGISMKSDCECISYPSDAHISHSGLYLNSLVNFKPYVYTGECDGEIWQIAEQSRVEAISEIEAALSGCMVSAGLTEAFSFSEQIGQMTENGKSPIKLNADFVNIKVCGTTKKAGSSVTLKYLYFLPFYKFDGTNYYKSQVSTSLNIYRNGVLQYAIDDIIINPAARYNRIDLQELIDVKLDGCDTWEFVLSLWGQDYLGNSNYSAPYRIFPSDNMDYKHCCGAVPPPWKKHIGVGSTYGNNLGTRNTWESTTLSVSHYMGGVYFEGEGGCDFRDFICTKLGGKGNMLYRIYASALQKAWAAKFLDTMLHTDRVYEPCIRLSKQEIVSAITAYSQAVRQQVGGIDEKGVYQQGELCRALMNTPMKDTCYVCAANSIKMGRKI